MDRICEQVGTFLTADGMLLLTHSSLCDEQQTPRKLKEHQLEPRVLATRTEPFGPVTGTRAHTLEARGLVQPVSVTRNW